MTVMGRGLWFNKNVGTACCTGKFRLQFGRYSFPTGTRSAWYTNVQVIYLQNK